MYFSQNGFLLVLWMVNEITGKAEHDVVDEPWQARLYSVSSNVPVVLGYSGLPIRPTKFRRPTTTRRPFRTRPPPVTSRPTPQTTPPAPVESFQPPIMDTLPSPEAPVLQSPPENVPGLSSEDSLMESGPITTSIIGGETNVLYPEATFDLQEIFGNEQSFEVTTTSPIVGLPEEQMSSPLPDGGSSSLPEDTISFQSQPELSPEMAQPPFVGSNIPPNPPPAPTLSQGNQDDPHAPLIFPVVRPPSFIHRPPSRPRPSQDQLKPQAQPPFDNSPFMPPNPPPVPTTSTTSFAVPPGKPQRPLPPSRPFQPYPQPLPKPPFELTTTEKPSLVYSESSMAADGNYSFDFLVSNSVYRKEQGFLKKSLEWPGQVVHVKTGAYAFTSPDGVSHRVDFVADENGYRAFESTG